MKHRSFFSIMYAILIGAAVAVLAITHPLDSMHAVLEQPAQSEQSTDHDSHLYIAGAMISENRKTERRTHKPLFGRQVVSRSAPRSVSITAFRQSTLSAPLILQSLASVIIRS